MTSKSSHEAATKLSEHGFDISTRGAIVMAVYKPAEVLLRRQLESLRRQTLVNWTAYLGIDGADHEVRRMLERLVADNARFHIIEFDLNVGVYKNFERLLKLVPASARWVALCDQDDYWYPQKLERLVPLLSSEVAAAMGQARLVDGRDRPLGHTHRHQVGPFSLLMLNQVSGCFVVLRRDVCDRADPFPPSVPLAIHDHWLAVVASWTGHVVVVEESLQDYVQHAGNAIGERPVRPLMSSLGALVREPKSLEVNAIQPWLWRVTLARGVARRFRDTPRSLRDLASGHLTGGIASGLAGCVRRGEMAPQIALALAIGGLTARLFRSADKVAAA